MTSLRSIDGAFHPGSGMKLETHLLHGAPAEFAAFIQSKAFPCVGAKSALALGALNVIEAGSIKSAEDDASLHKALKAFAAKALLAEAEVSSLACLFQDDDAMTERAFETALWSRLQALHDIDATYGAPWADGVSQDTQSSNFSMSIGGSAYFVIGLHPGASRRARRFLRPALIFNLHEQFERLRADGRFYAMQKIIRDREVRQNGGVNPMLGDFGKRAEAAQYSGRLVDKAWRCPLRVKS